MSKQTPGAPKKAPYKGILPSSRFHTENNENNLTNNNTNVEELSENELEEMVTKTQASHGNTNPNYSKSKLNYKPKVPLMKLPAHLQKGGKKTRRRNRNRKSKGTRRR